MRPRLITAENVGVNAVNELNGKASMRPRLITAENLGDTNASFESASLQ